MIWGYRHFWKHPYPGIRKVQIWYIWIWDLHRFTLFSSHNHGFFPWENGCISNMIRFRHHWKGNGFQEKPWFMGSEGQLSGVCFSINISPVINPPTLSKKWNLYRFSLFKPERKGAGLKPAKVRSVSPRGLGGQQVLLSWLKKGTYWRIKGISFLKKCMSWL